MQALVSSGGGNSWTLAARACNCCHAPAVRLKKRLAALGLRLDEHALQARIGPLDRLVELVHHRVRAAARNVAGDVEADRGEDVFRSDMHSEHFVYLLDLRKTLRQTGDFGNHFAVRGFADEQALGLEGEPGGGKREDQADDDRGGGVVESVARQVE